MRHDEQFGNEVGWIARSIALHQGFSSPFFMLTGPTALWPPVYPYILSVIFRVFGIYSVKSALTILTLNSLFSALACVPMTWPRGARSTRALQCSRMGWAMPSLRNLSFRWPRVGILADILAADDVLLAGVGPASRFAANALAGLWGAVWTGRALQPRRLLAVSGAAAASAVEDVEECAALPVTGPLADCSPETFCAAELFAAVGALRCADAVDRAQLSHHARSMSGARLLLVRVLVGQQRRPASNPTLEWTHPASNPGEMRLYQSQGEIAYIAQKRDMAMDYVSRHPGFFVRLTLRRVVNYWTGFWSLDPNYIRQEPFQLPNVFFCTSLTLLLLFGARDWWRRDRDAALPYLLSIAIFPIAYYISHPLMDYRQPIEPEIVVLVVVGLRAVKARIGSRVKEPGTMRESEAAAIFAQMGDSVSFPMEHAFDADDCSCAVCIAAGAAVGPSATIG